MNSKSSEIEICTRKDTNFVFFFKDSLRYLVQFSLKAYTQMIVDACYSVMEVADDMKWEDGVLKSPYL